MKTCPIFSCVNAFIQETSRYRALTFQSQVSFTSGKSRQGWYQSKRFVSRQTKYCITSERSYFLALLHGVARVVFLRRRKRRRRKTPRRFLCRSRRRYSLVSASGRSVKHARAREFARNVTENASSRVLSRDCKLHLCPGGDRRKRARLSGIPGGGRGCNSSSYSSSSPPRRIYTGHSPGQ